jgi:hypothetical protein
MIQFEKLGRKWQSHIPSILYAIEMFKYDKTHFKQSRRRKNKVKAEFKYLKDITAVGSVSAKQKEINRLFNALEKVEAIMCWKSSDFYLGKAKIYKIISTTYPQYILNWSRVLPTQSGQEEKLRTRGRPRKNNIKELYAEAVKNGYAKSEKTFRRENPIASQPVVNQPATNGQVENLITIQQEVADYYKSNTKKDKAKQLKSAAKNLRLERKDQYEKTQDRKMYQEIIADMEQMPNELQKFADKYEASAKTNTDEFEYRFSAKVIENRQKKYEEYKKAKLLYSQNINDTNNLYLYKQECKIIGINYRNYSSYWDNLLLDYIESVQKLLPSLMIHKNLDLYEKYNYARTAYENYTKNYVT